MGRRRPRRTNFTESLFDNDVIYGQYMARLAELSISMFEWKNVPEEIDLRYLELALFSDGKAVFFRDEDLDEYLALRVALHGRFTVYNIPIQRRAYASNGYNKELDDKNSVIIWNNKLHTNSVTDVAIYAKKLYMLDRIVDVNANAQKTPVLVQGTENQRLTLINVYKEFEGNAPVIFGDKNLDLNCLSVLKTDAPFVADKIYQLKIQYWNEALTYLGISNINTQKKERLVTDEVVRSQGGTIASRYSRLDSRRKACEEINKMFGLNMEVDFRQDFREIDDQFMIDGPTGENSVFAQAYAIDKGGGSGE